MLTTAAWLPAEAFAGKYNSQGAATSLGQFFAAYFSLFIILLLPKCSLRMKVESMTSMLCFLPVSNRLCSSVCAALVDAMLLCLQQSCMLCVSPCDLAPRWCMGMAGLCAVCCVAQLLPDSCYLHVSSWGRQLSAA